MVLRAVRLIVLGLVLALVASPAAPAFANTALLKRSASNLIGGPVDLAVVPYTMGESLVRGFYMSKSYSVVEKILLSPVWFVVYLPSCNFVSSMMPAARFVEGAAMLPVGVVTAAAGSDYDWGVFEQLPGKGSALLQKPPMFYLGTRWCRGFFQ